MHLTTIKVHHTGHRKSRYDNSENLNNGNQLVPFHTQLYEEGSFNEECSKVIDDKSSDKQEVK